MARKIKTFISDLQWIKRCRKKIYEIIEDDEGARKVVEFLDKNPELRRDLAFFYIKAKERLEKKE